MSRLTEVRSALHLVQRERYLNEAALREERACRQFVEGELDVLPEKPALGATQFPRVVEFVQRWSNGARARSTRTTGWPRGNCRSG